MLSAWLSCARIVDTKSTLNAGGHPLDPLSPEEIKTTAGVIKAKAAELSLPNLGLNVITLAVSPQPIILTHRKFFVACPLLRVPMSYRGSRLWQQAALLTAHVTCTLYYSAEYLAHMSYARRSWSSEKPPASLAGACQGRADCL